MSERMRRALLVLVIVSFAMVVLRASGGEEAPTGPTRVVTGEPVRVVMGANPSAATIEQRTADALGVAARSASDPLMQAGWRDLSDDAATVEAIAISAASRLSAGRAAALAFPMFSVDAGGERLTIVAMTVEIIPGRPGMAVSREHEDGHAEVNDQLALRCGPLLAEASIANGLTGAVLEHAITAGLNGRADEAHTVYHGMVQQARLGEHLESARRAAAQVAAEGCA